MGIFCPKGAKNPHFLLLFSPFTSGKGARGIGLSSYEKTNNPPPKFPGLGLMVTHFGFFFLLVLHS